MKPLFSILVVLAMTVTASAQALVLGTTASGLVDSYFTAGQCVVSGTIAAVGSGTLGTITGTFGCHSGLQPTYSYVVFQDSSGTLGPLIGETAPILGTSGTGTQTTTATVNGLNTAACVVVSGSRYWLGAYVYSGQMFEYYVSSSGPGIKQIISTGLPVNGGAFNGITNNAVMPMYATTAAAPAVTAIIINTCSTEPGCLKRQEAFDVEPILGVRRRRHGQI